MRLLARLFSRRRRYDDIAVSIQEHIDERAEELIAGGMPPMEAERTARREFGNATLIEERSREMWQWPMLESLWADGKYALRQLLKSPGITLITVLTLALGIGANTAIFTLTWNIVLKSLPVPHPDRLVDYEMRKGDNPDVLGLSGPEYTLLRQRQKSCVDLLAWSSDRFPVRDGAHTTQLHVQFLTTNSFRILEMQPYLGRPFSEMEDRSQGAQGVAAILSYDAWQQQFRGDNHVLGKTIYIDNHPVTIVGIMPRAFEGLTANLHPAVYLPMFFANALYGSGYTDSPNHFGYFVMGRLKPHATLAMAEAEVRAIEPSLRKDADPAGIYLNQFFKDFRLTVQPGHSGVSWVKMVYARPLLALEMLVLFLLVLCALNTALVMQARVGGRRQEYALRAALGARRIRLIRQVLLETILLAIPGLAGGIFFGWAAARVLVDMLGSLGSPQQMDLHPNGIILAFNLVSTLLIALGAGVVPALRAAGTTPALDLKAIDHGVASKHLGGWVIAFQVAVSLCLVSAATLFSGTLLSLFTDHTGFRIGNAATAEIVLAPLKLDKAQTARLSAALVAVVQSSPGVVSAGFAHPLPLSNFFGASGMFSIDRNHVVHSDRNIASVNVSPGYFAAAGTRILSGESIAAPSDGQQGEPGNCALSEAQAQSFFPNENAIGQFVYYSTWGKPDGTVITPKDSCRVVAVVEDAKYTSLRKPAPHIVYSVIRPEAQSEPVFGLMVRARTDALALAAIHQAVSQTLPPGALTLRTQTFTQLADQNLSRERMLVSLSGCFAVLALLLTALGLYGLLMRSVSLRTREIGIRIALGARRKAILVSIVGRVLLEVFIGLLAGSIFSVVLCLEADRLLSLSAPIGVDVYLLSVALLLAVVAVAVYPPAIRSTAIDPIQALRSE